MNVWQSCENSKRRRRYTAWRTAEKRELSLGDQIAAQLEGQPPDAVILFVSPKYDAATLVGERGGTQRRKDHRRLFVRGRIYQ